MVSIWDHLGSLLFKPCFWWPDDLCTYQTRKSRKESVSDTDPRFTTWRLRSPRPNQALERAWNPIPKSFHYLLTRMCPVSNTDLSHPYFESRRLSLRRQLLLRCDWLALIPDVVCLKTKVQAHQDSSLFLYDALQAVRVPVNGRALEEGGDLGKLEIKNSVTSFVD